MSEALKMFLLSYWHNFVSRHTVVLTNTEGDICTQVDIDLFMQSVNKPEGRDIVTDQTNLPKQGHIIKGQGPFPFCLPLYPSA